MGRIAVAPTVSIVVPVLNEAEHLGELLRALRCGTVTREIVVVDGGSSDHSCAVAAELADRVLIAGPGRAAQMNAGAASARGGHLWFVHGDSALLAPADVYLAAIAGAAVWGFFPLRLSGRRRSFRVIEWAICRRSRLTAVATGDQGLFARRDQFEAVGGFPDLPLMEDVAISKRLRRRAAPLVPAAALMTSSRRWEQGGTGRTVLLMWQLRLRYFLGADPARLARGYRRDVP